MTYLVSQTKSYTLVISSGTGEMRLELADELKKNLAEMLAEADTSTDAANVFFDIMGDDAAAYLEAIGELLGVGGELAVGFGEGGVEALEGLLSELAAGNDLTGDMMERLAEGGTFGGFGSSFVEMPGSDVEDILGYGSWDGPNHNDFDPSAQDAGVMNRGAGEQRADALVSMLLKAADGGRNLDANYNDAAESIVDFVLWWNDPNRGEDEKTIVDEVTFIPANPEEGYINPLDNPFGPHWANEEALDNTYGEILTDPNDESGVSSDEEPDPEAELAKEILTDLEAEQQNYTAEGVINAAQAPLVNTTLPVDPDGEPDFHFNDMGGEAPDLGGGEDYTGEADGSQAQTGELDLAVFDEPEFTEGEGQVISENTSGAVLEAQVNPMEVAGAIAEQML